MQLATTLAQRGTGQRGAAAAPLQLTAAPFAAQRPGASGDLPLRPSAVTQQPPRREPLRRAAGVTDSSAAESLSAATSSAGAASERTNAAAAATPRRAPAEELQGGRRGVTVTERRLAAPPPHGARRGGGICSAPITPRPSPTPRSVGRRPASARVGSSYRVAAGAHWPRTDALSGPLRSGRGWDKQAAGPATPRPASAHAESLRGPRKGPALPLGDLHGPGTPRLVNQLAQELLTMRDELVFQYELAEFNGRRAATLEHEAQVCLMPNCSFSLQR